jgi:hypothetical protein
MDIKENFYANLEQLREMSAIGTPVRPTATGMGSARPAPRPQPTSTNIYGAQSGKEVADRVKAKMKSPGGLDAIDKSRLGVDGGANSFVNEAKKPKPLKAVSNL